MPILPRKNSPPSKSFEETILEKPGVWWIAKVKPRQEKAFALDLLEQSVDYYIPCYEKHTRKNDGRIRTSELLLFPSYVPFLANETCPAFSYRRISAIYCVRAQNRFRAQLHAIYRAKECDMRLCGTHGPEDRVGERIQVLSGPLNGLEGNRVCSGDAGEVLFTVDGLGNVVAALGDVKVVSLGG